MAPFKMYCTNRVLFTSIFFTITISLLYYLVKSLYFIEDNAKYVLFWIPMYNSKTFYFGTDKYELFKKCKVKNCYATHNRDLVSLHRFDAVVFHIAQYDASIQDKPSKRYSYQRYIFANMESPMNALPSSFELYKSFYNWTMTYRLDSDIPRPYGRIVKNKTEYTMNTTESVKKKTRLVAWAVSHCTTFNKRTNLYENLRLFLDIHVYGACGTYKCPFDIKNHQSRKSVTNCYDFIEDHYKFMLSFENTHCKDYVTEKLFVALKRNIVPIVYGAVNYREVAPPNSVIIAEEFSNVENLANYILFLDKNDTEYLKYFEWKKDYCIETKEDRTICRLCEMLNDPLQPPKVYLDISMWWLGKHNTYCKAGFQLTNISRSYFEPVNNEKRSLTRFL